MNTNGFKYRSLSVVYDKKFDFDRHNILYYLVKQTRCSMRVARAVMYGSWKIVVEIYQTVVNVYNIIWLKKMLNRLIFFVQVRISSVTQIHINLHPR